MSSLRQTKTDLVILLTLCAVIVVSLFFFGYRPPATGKVTINTNESTSIVSVTVVNSGPGVILSSPSNGSTTSSTPAFVCNLTDDFDLVNATLFTNISGSFVINQTVTISGTNETSITFNVTTSFSSDTGIIWNCRACDGNGVCSDGASNFSLTVQAAPTPSPSGAGPQGKGGSAGGPGKPPKPEEPKVIPLPLPVIPLIPEAPLEYNLEIVQVMLNETVIFSHGAIRTNITLDDFSSYSLTVVVRNVGEGKLHDIQFQLQSPNVLNLVSLQPENISMLAPEEEAAFTAVIEAEDLKTPFFIKTKATSLEAATEMSFIVLLHRPYYLQRLFPGMPFLLYVIIALSLILLLLRILALEEAQRRLSTWQKRHKKHPPVPFMKQREKSTGTTSKEKYTIGKEKHEKNK